MNNIKFLLNKYIAFIALSFFLISCNSNELTEVVIYYTNDTHGRLINYSKIKHIIDSEKKKNENVFLVSSGDIFSGNPIVDRYEKKGFPMIDIMNKVGYNASVFGNHEFDYGQVVLANRIEQAKFDFICANMDIVDSKLPKIKPYVILETSNKLKLAFLGLLQVEDNGIPATHPKRLIGLKFRNPLDSLEKYSNLKKENNALIVLSHLGYKTDTILAQKFQDADIIIGGHSHTLLTEADSVKNVLITQSGAYLDNLGKIVLIFKGDKLISKTVKLINLDKYEVKNAEIAKSIDVYINNPIFKKVIGTADEKISGNDELGSLMTDALTSIDGIDIAFQNHGGIRDNEIDKGNITLESIYKLEPFNNEVTKMVLTTNEIRGIISTSYYYRNKNDVQVSGIKFIIITQNDSIKDIKLQDYEGKAIDEKKTYNVALNSYMAKTLDFEHSDKGTPTGIYTCDRLIEYIKEKKNLKYNGVIRAITK